MRIVVDTNIIFSALISRKSNIRDILLESDLDFYSPDFVLTEIYNNTDKLLKYCKLTEDELLIYLSGIFGKIHFIPIDFISSDSIQKAYILCSDLDLSDLPFVALTIEIDAKLWTGDKKLRKGLKRKGFNNIYKENKV